MLGPVGAGLMRAFPTVRQAGRVHAAAAASAARRCQNLGAVVPGLRPPAGVGRELLTSIQQFSSMTPSRAGGDEDSMEDEGSSRQAGVGGGALSGFPLPRRTVPDDILGFSCRTYIAGDSDDRYPNVHGVHPAEFKVELTVHVPLLGLSPAEEERLIQIVGPRYLKKTRVLRLVSDRFPNRIDNKRYLVHLLENILVEARNVEDGEA